MKKEEIFISDWMRIFFGEVPAEFYVEIIIRVAVSYLIVMLAIRLTGKRMAAQLDRVEMAGIVTLAAAIGVPLQTPDRGLLPMFIIAAIVVVVGRLVSRLAYKSQKIEKVTHGDIGTLVSDGVMQLRNMESSLVTVERLMAQLRYEGFYHLGQLRRVYLEAGGMFTVVPAEKPQPGLSVIPAWDKQFISELRPHHAIQVCCGCGKRNSEGETSCSQCGASEFANAVDV